MAFGGNRQEKKKRDALYRAAIAYLTRMEENPMGSDYDLLGGTSAEQTEETAKKSRGRNRRK